jgi:hypothetical protein
MPTCTPIYGLPVPAGTDNPCTLGTTLCSFAEAVNEQLNRLDGIVARTATTVPMVEVSMTIPMDMVVPGTATVVDFDTVLFDTNNMADLTLLPGFTTTSAGIYYIWFMAMGTVTIASVSAASLGASISSSNPAFYPGDTNSTTTFGPQVTTVSLPVGNFAFTGAMSTVAVAGMQFFLSMFPNGNAADAMTLNEVRFGATYLGDVP